jgi:hypothetical protein
MGLAVDSASGMAGRTTKVVGWCRKIVMEGATVTREEDKEGDVVAT